jgi:hypothetical protein
MRKNSVGLLFFLAMTACGGNRSASNTERPPNGCGDKPCEVTAYAYHGTGLLNKINLSHEEQTSLGGALAAAGASGPNELSHIHADATNGKLVFSSDTSSDQTAASHLVGNEREIALSEGGPTKKVVATPAANELLEKRAVR